MPLSGQPKRHAEAYGLTEYEQGEINQRSLGRSYPPLNTPWDDDRIYYLCAREFTAQETKQGECRYVVPLLREDDLEPELLSLHVVPADMVGENDKAERMLRNLADRFGLGVKVGSETGPYFASDGEVRRAAEEEKVEVAEDAPAGHTVLKEARIRVGDDYVKVLLAFAIDATAVAEHLGLK